MTLFRAKSPPPLPRFDCHVQPEVETLDENVAESLAEDEVCGAAIALPQSLVSSIDSIRARWDRRQLRFLAAVGAGDQAGEIDHRFTGLHLDPENRGLPGDELFATARERSLPVLIDGGEAFVGGAIAEKILPLTSGPVIIAHLGSWPCAEQGLFSAVEAAEREKRIFLETSGTSIGNFFHYAIARVPEQILFGTYAPVCHPSSQWSHAAASIVDDAVLSSIAWENAASLFDLQTP